MKHYMDRGKHGPSLEVYAGLQEVVLRVIATDTTLRDRLYLSKAEAKRLRRMLKRAIKKISP